MIDLLDEWISNTNEQLCLLTLLDSFFWNVKLNWSWCDFCCNVFQEARNDVNHFYFESSEILLSKINFGLDSCVRSLLSEEVDFQDLFDLFSFLFFRRIVESGKSWFKEMLFLISTDEVSWSHFFFKFDLFWLIKRSLEVKEELHLLEIANKHQEISKRTNEATSFFLTFDVLCPCTN